MNISAKAITDNHSVKSILAWPHDGKPFPVTEDQVLEKVATTLEAELNLSPGQLADDTPIKNELSANIYDLVGPIMTIENLFRTLLQDELARDDLSVSLIVDRLIGRQNGAAGLGAGNDCACAV
jgi:hypothetical protein